MERNTSKGDHMTSSTELEPVGFDRTENLDGGVIGALLGVQEDLDAIIKNRRSAQDGNYAFRGIDHVYNTLHPLFVKHQLMIKIHQIAADHVEMKRQPYMRVDTHVLYRVYHIDSSFVCFESISHGIDGWDKAPGKALSYAYKAAVLSLLSAPTEDPDMDNENSGRPESWDDAKPAEPQQRPQAAAGNPVRDALLALHKQDEQLAADALKILSTMPSGVSGVMVVTLDADNPEAKPVWADRVTGPNRKRALAAIEKMAEAGSNEPFDGPDPEPGDDTEAPTATHDESHLDAVMGILTDELLTPTKILAALGKTGSAITLTQVKSALTALVDDQMAVTSNGKYSLVNPDEAIEPGSD